MTARPDLTEWTSGDLVRALDVVEDALTDNLARWFAAPSAALAREALEERKCLHRRRTVLEEELRRRWEQLDDDR